MYFLFLGIFLGNIFFSLAYFIVRIQKIIEHTKYVLINSMLLARLPVINRRLFVITFWGKSKVICGFLTA